MRSFFSKLISGHKYPGGAIVISITEKTMNRHLRTHYYPKISISARFKSGFQYVHV